jgi:hypothetical protein
MATTRYIVWNKLEHRVEEGGPYPSSNDATAALRKAVGKSGAVVNDKKSGLAASDCEVVAVTCR